MSIDWSAVFAESFAYEAFLDRHASPPQRARWDAMHERYRPSEAQAELLRGFTRELKVLVMAGAWCGDCVNQVPIFARFAELSPKIQLKIINRDARDDVSQALSINGGKRVPAVLFLSEDYDEVARYGERTLAAYRKLSLDQLGAACPTGIVPPDETLVAAVAQEWLDQFERAHLIVRMSPKFRERYGD